MKKIIYILTSLFLTGSILSSCTKAKDEAIGDTEMLTASAIIDMNHELDFSSGIDQAIINDSYHESIPAQVTGLPPCASVTVETAAGGAFPRTFTVDFGSGCEYNGFTRSGKLIITLDDYFMNPGSEMTVERENYKVDGWAIEGKVTFVNETTDAAIPSWSRSTTNGVFTNPDGVVFTHYGNRTIKQIEGFLSPEIDDNVYEISAGNHHLSRDDGNTLNISIVSPVIKAMSCDYISKGIMHIEGGLLNGNIDYGNGDCDNTAVYTHNNGLTFTIDL